MEEITVKIRNMLCFDSLFHDLDLVLQGHLILHCHVSETITVNDLVGFHLYLHALSASTSHYQQGKSSE